MRLIDADRLLSHIEELIKAEDLGNTMSDIGFGLTMAKTAIKSCETADSAKRGQWLAGYERFGVDIISVFKCSECGNCVPTRNRYCDRCGAKLEG